MRGGVIGRGLCTDSCCANVVQAPNIAVFDLINTISFSIEIVVEQLLDTRVEGVVIVRISRINGEVVERLIVNERIIPAIPISPCN